MGEEGTGGVVDGSETTHRWSRGNVFDKAVESRGRVLYRREHSTNYCVESRVRDG